MLPIFSALSYESNVLKKKKNGEIESRCKPTQHQIAILSNNSPKRRLFKTGEGMKGRRVGGRMVRREKNDVHQPDPLLPSTFPTLSVLDYPKASGLQPILSKKIPPNSADSKSDLVARNCEYGLSRL